MEKKSKEVIYIIGLTGIFLLILCFFLFFGEKLGLIELRVGESILGLSPLDVWLIIILVVFAPAIFITLYLLNQYRLLET